MTPLLVIDVHNLCHRAWHALPKLATGDRPTQVIFGFLRSIEMLRRHFATDRFAFCFEHPVSFRQMIYPQYKKRRHSKVMTPEEQEARNQLTKQIAGLRKKHLPEAGFRNIFRFRGMESDDIMAAIAFDATDDEEVVLITSDKDLYQCLRPNVMMYDPNKKEIITEKTFVEKHGIAPRKWAVVKAIAGCSTDEVPGILGVGEMGALKYVRGILKTQSSQYYWITCAKGKALVRHNRQLVRLPLENCPIPEIGTDDRIRWNRLISKAVL